MIEAKPYKLFNKIQNYDWGTTNKNAFIPKFIEIEIEKDLPYAELWIGAHTKAPSEIFVNEKKYQLNKLIDKYPLEILGKTIADKFDNKLPFLLKVLSASRALSIQTHPNKLQAKELHGKDPVNYPDDNHKPEIAIAIDSLSAIAGFKPIIEIVENLKRNPEFRIIAGPEIIDKIIDGADETEREGNVKHLYALLMNKADDKETLHKVIEKISERLSVKNALLQEEEQFLKQHLNFGVDVGLLSFFFFNIINLKPDQAIFTEAGVPHAYIEGNIIECMANSDNVVRAGLTNKFKDINTLLKIMKYNFNKYEIINSEQLNDEHVFVTEADEFQITMFNKSAGYSRKYLTNAKPAVVLIMNGQLKIESAQGNPQYCQYYKKGDSFLVPAIMDEFQLTCDTDSKYLLVEIPTSQ